MTSPAMVQRSYRRDLTQHGRVVQLRRYTGSGPGRTFVDTPVHARVRGYQPQELVNTIQQGDRNVIALAEDLINGGFALPVTASDKLIIDGKELAVLGIDDSTRRVGETLIAIELQCRG
jgi:hypothetical protein